MPMPVRMSMPMSMSMSPFSVTRHIANHPHRLVQHKERCEPQEYRSANHNVPPRFQHHRIRVSCSVISSLRVRVFPEKGMRDEVQEDVPEETAGGECDHGIQG